MFHRVGVALSSPSILSDANALLYSAKSFAAAMLAYYLALSIGLDKPSWAIVTVYIVSQTSVGASLSRSVYRLVGTVIGAAATVLIVPTFVNMPIVCSIVLAGWIALCLYFSLLERTPRAYAFVLAGYTASLIGFPAVFDPSAIFDIAVIRVQEIMIGILCVGLIHRYVFPKRLSGMFNRKLSETLHSARQMLTDTLKGTSVGNAGNLQLALALQFLQGVNHHLPYDFAISVPAQHARKIIHDRLARLLVVNSELHDRMPMINAFSPALQRLLEDVKSWLIVEDANERKQQGDTLTERSATLAEQLESNARTFEEKLQVSFSRYLQEALDLLQQCYRLADAIHHAKPVHLQTENQAAKGYVFHRDSLTALRTALGAFVIILSGCLVWIYSAWPDGAMAVSILGVCCTLFGSFDTPAPHIVKYIVGSVYGVAISLIYTCILLPQVTEFNVLIAVLAPVYLLAGSLQARPPTTFLAMGITLTLPILSELDAHYRGDFVTAVNTAIALFVATGFAVVSMGLLQTVQADAAIHRLLKICRRDIRHSKRSVVSNDVYWTNLMIDRTALLLPRLPRSKQSSGQVLNQMLHYLRIGLTTLHLRRLRTQLGEEIATEINEILHLLAQEADTRILQQRIDSMIAIHSPSMHEPLRQLIYRLIDLRCALMEQDKRLTDD
ncbi:FUSC family protein [Pectobacterium sp. B1J-3]|uniref:FUSC family protein n=1 Tax=Pectobacterium sp. B1J-3 TaxID=3385371 RepID=UPI003905DACB